MYLYLKYFSRYLYLSTLVGKVFAFLKNKCICISIEIHFHVTMYVLIHPVVSDYTVLESDYWTLHLQLLRRCVRITRTSTGD